MQREFEQGQEGDSQPDTAGYDWIYLSPHLDDVALSCGGQIFQHTQGGENVLIVTVMAGDPPQEFHSDYVESLHERWALATDATTARRREDLAACRILGADAWHMAWPDCIYRVDPENGTPYYASDADIFGEIAASEEPLIDEIAVTLASLPTTAHMVAPLGVGHHVDHQLTRAAALRCFGEGNLWYYEEFPYADKHGAVHAVVSAGPVWEPRVITLNKQALDVKFDAISAFASQLSTFFTSRSDLENQVRSYARQVGGERLWHRTLQNRT